MKDARWLERSSLDLALDTLEAELSHDIQFAQVASDGPS